MNQRDSSDFPSGVHPAKKHIATHTDLHQWQKVVSYCKYQSETLHVYGLSNQLTIA